MDLLCTENIWESEVETLQRTLHEQQPSSLVTATSPFSSHLAIYSPSSSSSSSGYNSITSNSSSTACTSNTCTSCCRTPRTRQAVDAANGSSIDDGTTSAGVTNSATATATATTTTVPLSCYDRVNRESDNINSYHQHHNYHHHNSQGQESQFNSNNNNNNNNNNSSNNLNRGTYAHRLDVNVAIEDSAFLTDRCLQNMLKTEEKRPHPDGSYFKTVQKDITPAMRKIVAEWMMEVCAEEKCQEEVVLLALNYMDRILSTKSLMKTHLQILAAACLLLASKLREPSSHALSAEVLVFYTDNSIYKSDLIKWELFVLSRLGWDLSTVTPLDFLELLLRRIPIRDPKCADVTIDKVRQHAQAFICLAAKEHEFSMYSASAIAASSIAAALRGLNWHVRTNYNLSYLLGRLTDLTSIAQSYIEECMKKMELVFEEHSRNLQPYLVSVDPQHQHQQQQQQQHQHFAHQQMQSSDYDQENVSNNNIISINNSNGNANTSIGSSMGSHGPNVVTNTAGMLPDLTQTCKMQANAQRGDMHDVKF